MRTSNPLHRLALLAFLGTTALGSRSEAANATLMRYPTLHGDTVVFVAHDNLWSVPRSGGTAARLTSDEGRDVMPRFSPDGKWIAFTGEYQGNRDVYVMPAAGGQAQRLTFTSDVEDEVPLRWGPNNMVVTWTPDSKSVVFLSRREAWNSWFGRLFTVPVSGGLPVALPLDRGGLMSYSPDGGKIAYNRIFRNFRTWKRYEGGLAQDIDVYDFTTRQLTHVTDWPGTETSPMWYGRTIYFLSDHDARRRANIWAWDTETHAFREVTQFTDYDIDFPSLGQGGDAEAGIVFQQGGHLFVLDLPSERLHQLEVSVPDDGTRTGPRFVDASQLVREEDAAQQTDFDLAPNGKRAVFSARGDLFTVPAEHGNTRNLTETSSADEDHPAWSPDGRTIAYTTDASGEQQLAVRPAEGGPEKVLTRFDRGFVYSPVWAPGGDRLAFSDHEHRLWLVPATGGEPVQVAQDPYSEVHDYSWSPDGRWVAYSLTGANQQRGIWLYEVATRKASRVSLAFANDFDPVFDPKGRYLYFVSTRHENPAMSESEFDVAALKATGIYVATLLHDTPSPFAPRSDEGAFATGKPQAGVKPEREDTAETEREKAEKKEQEEWKPGASQPIKLELEGLMARAVPLPIPAADISGLQARDDRVFYGTSPSQTIEGPLPGEKPALHVYDIKERKDAVVVEGLSGFVVSADGKKVLYKKEKSYLIADATKGADEAEAKDDKGPKTLDLTHMRVRVLPAQEWAEVFANAWRLERDFFFNPKMNDVDWPAVRASYARLLPLAGSRGDVNYLVGEMLGELSNSHTYVGGGDAPPDEKRVATAFLGADFALDAASGRYRLATIYPGDNTRADYRAPLSAPGLGVKAGQYLLAIDGKELQAPTDPGSLLVGKQDRTVKLTLADSPGGARREVVVQPVKNELSLREQAWIDHNRQAVDAASGGRVGYIYLSDMSGLGMQQFIRQFYPQLDKQALIVDDRWNGGGFIDQIVLERLRRILVGLVTNRERMPFTVPSQLIRGPKACLINHYSASDGDIFPFYFRKYGLGPLIGTRTWGGVRGIRGDWPLLDGGYVTVPEDSLYGLDSQWVMENHGVDPDQPVDDSPADWAAGHDVQLEAAIRYLLDELQKKPEALPSPPPLSPPYPPGQ
ncbi:MAG TPA: S41 family peptidase [Vicinamibacteria bacterium]|nr:S41 family peptidase [Vicinamibacteria bacterium]